MNPADTDAPVQLEVTGAKTLVATGTALTLAGDAQATNAIDAPTRLAPATTTVAGVKPVFTYPVPRKASSF